MSKSNKPATKITPPKKQKIAKKKKSGFGCLQFLFIMFVFIAAAAAGALFASSSLFDKPNRQRTVKTTEYEQEPLLYAEDKSLIMIMGIDEHLLEDDAGRSDTLMVATLDPKKDRAGLISIPRDTRVKIPGYGFDKINAAYALGGRELTQRTVENFLSVPMDHYVAIKVSAFNRIIDAIGGVDIDVEKRMYYEDPWDDNGGLIIDLQPGFQHMDGKTAITYVRYRDEEGDIGRVKRQQKFMKAVMAQVTSPSIIPRLPSIIREVSASVDTDLTVRQLLELAGSLKNAAHNGLKTEMIDGRPVYIDEISYWVPDISDVRTALAETLDIKLTATMIAAIEREEREYDASLEEAADEEDRPSTNKRRRIKESEESGGSTDKAISAREYLSRKKSPTVTNKADGTRKTATTSPRGQDGDDDEDDERERTAPSRLHNTVSKTQSDTVPKGRRAADSARDSERDEEDDSERESDKESDKESEEREEGTSEQKNAASSAPTAPSRVPSPMGGGKRMR